MKRLWLLCISLVCILFTTPAVASGKTSPARALKVATTQQARADLQAKIAAAQRALPAARQQAKVAQADLKSAVAALRQATGDLQSAQFLVKNATADMREIEAKLGGQKRQGNLAQANRELDVVRRRYQEAVDKALNSVVYRQAEANARSSADAARRLPELRRKTLEYNEDVKAAQHELLSAQIQQQRAESGVVYSDPAWVAAREELSQAKKREQSAKSRVSALLLRKNSASDRLRHATQAITKAEALVKQGPQALKKLNQSGSRNRGGNRRGRRANGRSRR